MNGLKLDSHTEEKAVELFAINIMKAGEAFMQNPMDEILNSGKTFLLNENSPAKGYLKDFIKFK